MSAAPSYRRTFARLLGFLRPYKWSLIVSILLAIGSQAAAVVIAFLTGDGLQEAATSGSREEIWWIALGILVAGLVRALLMMGRRLISGRQALAVEFDMRNGLYAKLQRLSFGFYDRHQTGQLMSRATVDLQAVRFFLGYGLIFFFQHITTIVGVTAVRPSPEETRGAKRSGGGSGAVSGQRAQATRQRALYVPLLSFLPL